MVCIQPPRHIQPVVSPCSKYQDIHLNAFITKNVSGSRIETGQYIIIYKPNRMGCRHTHTRTVAVEALSRDKMETDGVCGVCVLLLATRGSGKALLDM